MHQTRLQALTSIQKNSDYVDNKSGNRKISEKYAELVFTHAQMKRALDGRLQESFKKSLESGGSLDTDVAKALAEEIKNWALKNGVTHFTHWFQPLTGLTAEKHDSFISYDDKGHVIEKFSAGQLIQSEPDASSFPSGGMRSTFEARGYTAWDVHSPVFITEHAGSKILCIPSVFVSYTGHSLDTKTGLLRSLDRLNNVAIELLSEINVKASRVQTTIGCEQEYFLIDKTFLNMRPDLLLTGRTLIGGDMPKGQQLEDHYFGAIPTRIQAFMSEVENELYRLGVPVKTRHNEVAPSQFEMAPIFEEANLASDHNMLSMEVLRRTANKVGFACLLHEKPFAGINGSGKHNNWSMATDTGINLLDPGTTPAQNLRFLAVLACVLRAVNKNQVGLRAAIASHGNDHRLGANEAPPAIISVFLGETLSHILDTLEKEGDLSKISAEKAMIDVGINSLPKLPKDNTDRNRTSPFAFTGNKFEFRAVGSSQAISFPVTVLNAAVAESIKEFVNRLKEVKKSAVSPESAALQVVKEFVVESKAIRFEGNGYSDDWKQEAKKRGLKELLTTADALKEFSKKEHHQFLIETGIYSEAEFASILNVQLERYCKNLAIEAHTLATMVRQYVLPATQNYLSQLATGLKALESVGGDPSMLKSQRELVRELAENYDKSATGLKEVLLLVEKAEAVHEEFDKTSVFAKEVVPSMLSLRKFCDFLESRISDDLWPLPKYREMLFVR